MGTVSPQHARLHLSRRTFLGAGAAGLGLLIMRPAHAALPTETGARKLALQNLHTGERCATEYWCDGSYHPDALAQIAKVLRDHRTNDVHAIDPKLLDALHRLNAKLDPGKSFQVISGYRSPASNAKLAAASNGVARKSLHMQGMAIDIRMPGVELINLHKGAKSLGAGGVGYYAASNFVHMDVGRVRYW